MELVEREFRRTGLWFTWVFCLSALALAAWGLFGESPSVNGHKLAPWILPFGTVLCLLVAAMSVVLSLGSERCRKCKARLRATELRFPEQSAGQLVQAVSRNAPESLNPPPHGEGQGPVCVLFAYCPSCENVARVSILIEEAGRTRELLGVRTLSGSSVRRWLQRFSAASLFALAACSSGSAAKVASPAAVDDREQTAAGEFLADDVVKFGLLGDDAELRRCYESSESGGTGRARLSWSMQRDGTVVDVTVEESTFAAPETAACIADVVRRSRFSVRSRARARWNFVNGIADHDAGGAPRAPVRDEGPVLEPGSPGELDPDRFESVASGGFPVFSGCIREALDRDNRLAGSVRLRVTIDERGHVVDVTNAQSGVEDRRLLDCMAEGFFALEFDGPQGGPAHVIYSMLINMN